MQQLKVACNQKFDRKRVRIRDWINSQIEEPKDLVGKRLDILVTIPYARGVDSRSVNIFTAATSYDEK